MKKIVLAGLLVVPCLAWAQNASRKDSPLDRFDSDLRRGNGSVSIIAPSTLLGDYVEVRTASVFAGACHYNAELVTTGRDAIMAWNILRGDWKGEPLDGLRAIAVVNSPENLAEKKTLHRSELIIDSRASDAQARALVDALKVNYGFRSLGEVVAVRRAPITFEHEGRSYVVSAGDVAKLSVEGMANDECCKMPNLVWYEPLATLFNRKVGYTKNAQYSGGKAAESWQRGDENSAFYGTFFMRPGDSPPKLSSAAK
jgi:hypothetical protein